MTLTKSVGGLFGALAMVFSCALPSSAQDSFGGQQPNQGQIQGYQQPGRGQPSGPAVVGPGQGGQMSGPMSPGMGSAPSGGSPNFAQVAQYEAQDFGVQPTSQLHGGPMHGPTPTSIPGGTTITTQALWSALQQNPNGIAIFDVLGGVEILPNALNAVGAASSGSFDDQTQQQFGQFLGQVTGGNKQVPVLFYCLGPQCWMSYNAALRAINLGYSSVLWYRGGIEAWKGAGLPTQDVQMGGQY